MTLPPKISIITPSLNQGRYIDETIRSVLDQNYSNLEYIVIDGGSTDETVDILRKYDSRLSYWVSEPDNGQYDAINRGFSKSTGEIMAWINSDDKYMPWAFSVVSDVFSIFPEINWLTTSYPVCWDKKGRAVCCNFRAGFNKKAFYKGANLPCLGRYSHWFIQQESTFWRRSLWDKVNGIDASLALAGDFELWAKFFMYEELYSLAVPLGGFRYHDNQKTAHHFNAYIKEAESVLHKYGGVPYGKLETCFRILLKNLAGPREIGYRHALLRDLLLRFGVIYHVKRCIWDQESWKIKEGCII